MATSSHDLENVVSKDLSELNGKAAPAEPELQCLPPPAMTPMASRSFDTIHHFSTGDTWTNKVEDLNPSNCHSNQPAAPKTKKKTEFAASEGVA